MFQIESEIQSSRGAFVLQKVIYRLNSFMFLRAPAERKRPMGFMLAPAVQHSLQEKC
jgi:hypothetical protein